MHAASTAPPARALARLELTRPLLTGVVLLAVVLGFLGVTLYLLPRGHLSLPALQPAFRVVREADFQVGTSRVVHWGDEVILVVRRAEERYAGVQGVSPADGCLLRWDDEGLQIVSPCTHLIYDLQGTAVTGLSTVPLRRYAVFVRDGDVYVTRGAP